MLTTIIIVFIKRLDLTIYYVNGKRIRRSLGKICNTILLFLLIFLSPRTVFSEKVIQKVLNRVVAVHRQQWNNSKTDYRRAPLLKPADLVHYLFGCTDCCVYDRKRGGYRCNGLESGSFNDALRHSHLCSLGCDVAGIMQFVGLPSNVGKTISKCNHI